MSETDQSVTPRKPTATAWVGRVLTGLTAGMFIMSGIMKLKGGPELAEGMAHLGLPEVLIVPLAVVELNCAAFFLIPGTSIIGAILLTGYMGGAICSHLRVGDPIYVQVLLPILVWLAIYLREDRLRDLIPWRRQV